MMPPKFILTNCLFVLRSIVDQVHVHVCFMNKKLCLPVVVHSPCGTCLQGLIQLDHSEALPKK